MNYKSSRSIHILINMSDNLVELKNLPISAIKLQLYKELLICF